jgi:N-acyl-D-aspartate/D-glutamate deacylase
MLDIVVRGGTVVDGSGEPAVQGDVGIRDGRVVELGEVRDSAERVIDAEGRVVAPGFVDVHTHYDGQVLWDRTVSPSPLHGVTTVVAGNCGLSLAPVEPDDEDFLVRMFSRVEAIPLGSLQQGISFRWRSFGEFLDVVEQGGVAVNVGFLAGHSAIRRSVLGPRASSGPATEAEVTRMCALLDGALAAGALGFSSSTATTQKDGDGVPTPPNFATPDELVLLASVCRAHPGTSLEFIPASAARGFDEADLSLMARMSVAGRAPLNWNTVLLNYPAIPDIHERQLRSFDVGASAGGCVVPMLIPHNFRVRTDFLDSDVGFRSIAAFEDIFRRDVDGRVRALSDPDVRVTLVKAMADLPSGSAAMFGDALPELIVSDTGVPALQRLLGRRVADIARERSTSVIEAIFDLAVEARLDIGFVRYTFPPDDPARRALRAQVLRDPRLVLGASDGGAHVRGVVNVEYTTASFEELVRDEPVFSIEELVQELSDVPARLYGLRGRGRLAVGACADVVVFDPSTIASSSVSLARDLPGGAGRLFSSGVGIDHVLVNGRVIVSDGAFTGDAPGRVLRSGRDSGPITTDWLLARRRG